MNSGAILSHGTGSNPMINTTTVTVNTGGTWDMNTRQETIGYISGGGNIIVSSNTDPSLQLSLGGAGSGSIFSGIISGTGTGTLRISGSGTETQIFSGANTYSAPTAITGGMLNIRNATALGSTTAGTSVSTGAALQIENGITVGAEALTLSGTGVAADGALRSISGTNVWQGTVTLGSATRINSDAGTLTFNTAATSITGTQNLTMGGAGNCSINGTITTGTGTVSKDGVGALTLSGANAYSGGTILTSGTLNINNSSALGNLLVHLQSMGELSTIPVVVL
ncbi:MAG: autotransporter-associated beta strand repeat-containing protein [Cytophagales bacterium]|nr:autotransporter-associated beta strand repeat-containing protein [Cytophagales bacterium]